MRLLEFKYPKTKIDPARDEGDTILCYGKVESDSGDNEYTVAKYSDGLYGCQCIGKLFHRQVACKHIQLFREEERIRVEQESKTKLFWNKDWCNCSKSRTGDPVYFDNDKCTCGTSKHHYHCRWCGGIVQVG